MSPHYDSPAFFSLCSELVSTGTDKDCRLFFEAFAPFLVADWDRLVALFPKGHYQRLAHVLYLILKSTNESRLSFSDIDTPTIESFYAANRELYNSLEITRDTFIGCWQAVYYNHMPELKGTVSSRLVKTIRFYRQHKVSGLRLVADYCQYNTYKTELTDAFNPWIEFEQTIKGRVDTTEGITITETAFNMVRDIRNERPSDVIRAAKADSMFCRVGSPAR